MSREEPQELLNLGPIKFFDASQFDVTVDLSRGWAIPGETVHPETYNLSVGHTGLKKEFNTDSSTPIEVLRGLVTAPMCRLDEKCEKMKLKRDSTAHTKYVRSQMKAVRRISKHTLSVNDAIQWDSPRDSSQFNQPRPTRTPSTDLFPKRFNGPEPVCTPFYRRPNVRKRHRFRGGRELLIS